MAKRAKKLTHAAHIKRHTEGTSNEISFSVLDAAKNALDVDEGKDVKAKPPRFGVISLFTLHPRRKKPVATPTKEKELLIPSGEESLPQGSSTPTTIVPIASSSATAPESAPTLEGAPSVPARPYQSPEIEIARRKARRRRHRRIGVAFVVVATLALLAAGGTYVFKEFERNSNQVAQLNAALDDIARTDKVLLDLDEVLNAPLDPKNVQAMQEVQAALPQAERQLDEASARASGASEQLHDSHDKEAAAQALAAVSARRELISTGEQVVSEALDAHDGMQRADAAWAEVLAGDALVRDAAKLVADTTAENVASSKEKTDQAVVHLTAAQDQFAELNLLFPDADYSAYLDYLARRLEAMAAAAASDEALLAEDRVAAAEQNDAYNKADAAAADIAKTLPDDPADPIREVFERSTKAPLEAYSTARLQAGAADAFLRDYLGTVNK